MARSRATASKPLLGGAGGPNVSLDSPGSPGQQPEKGQIKVQENFEYQDSPSARETERDVYALQSNNYARRFQDQTVDFNLARHARTLKMGALKLETAVDLVTQRVNEILMAASKKAAEGASKQTSGDGDDLSLDYGDFKISYQRPPEGGTDPYYHFRVCYKKFSNQVGTCDQSSPIELFKYHKDDSVCNDDIHPEFLAIYAQYMVVKLFQGVSQSVLYPALRQATWERIGADLERGLGLVRYASVTTMSFRYFCEEDLGNLTQLVKSMENNKDAMTKLASEGGPDGARKATALLDTLRSFQAQAQRMCDFSGADYDGKQGVVASRMRKATVLYKKLSTMAQNLREDLLGAVRVYVRIKMPRPLATASLWSFNAKTKTVMVNKDGLKVNTAVESTPPPPPVLDEDDMNWVSNPFTEVYHYQKCAPSRDDPSTPAPALPVSNQDVFFGWNEMMKDVGGRYKAFKVQGVKSTFDQLKDGYSIVAFGYGYSGAGKTFTLFGNAGSEPDPRTGQLPQDVPGMVTLALSQLAGLDSIKLFLLVEESVDAVQVGGGQDGADNFTGTRGKLIRLYAAPDLEGLEDLDLPPHNEPSLAALPLELAASNSEKTHNFISDIIRQVTKFRRERLRIRATPNNPESSRSHLYMTFQLTFKATGRRNPPKVAYLTAADLAGREREEDFLLNALKHMDATNAEPPDWDKSWGPQIARACKPVSQSVSDAYKALAEANGKVVKKAAGLILASSKLARNGRDPDSMEQGLTEYYPAEFKRWKEDNSKIPMTDEFVRSFYKLPPSATPSYYMSMPLTIVQMLAECHYINTSLDAMIKFFQSRIKGSKPSADPDLQSNLTYKMLSKLDGLGGKSKFLMFANLKNIETRDGNFDVDALKSVFNDGKQALEFANRISSSSTPEEAKPAVLTITQTKPPTNNAQAPNPKTDEKLKRGGLLPSIDKTQGSSGTTQDSSGTPGTGTAQGGGAASTRRSASARKKM